MSTTPTKPSYFAAHPGLRFDAEERTDLEAVTAVEPKLRSSRHARRHVNLQKVVGVLGMSYVSRVHAIITNDAIRWELLRVVRCMRLPNCWIGAGFVRNAVWDHLHGRSWSPISSDVDVLWFDPDRTDPSIDQQIQTELRMLVSSVEWSVKNQARMHVHNGDAPYLSTTDAMRYWPETATAVAVRRGDGDQCEAAAPFGLDDLFGLILRPSPKFGNEKRHLYDERVLAKGWQKIWPLLRSV